jgi:NAD(P)H-flavin reductase/hemoglobin-like flavoprotein
MSTLSVLLKESWSYVEEDADDLINHMYARLFLAEPGLRDLFPVDMANQRNRMVGALVAMIQTVDDPERFGALLKSIGRDHRKYHVQPEHFAAVGKALLQTMRAYVGPRWSRQYEHAWRDAYEAVANQMLNTAIAEAGNPPFWHAEVVAHERRAPDIAVFTCRPMVPYRFRAGQYAHIEWAGLAREWRPFSIANAPRSDGSLEFHVRATQAGWLSAALVRRLRVGDVIRLGPPMGSTVLDRESTRDIVAIAGGTGLAPMKSLVDELSRQNGPRWLHLFIGARNRDELYDLPMLRHWASRLPWLSLVPACSDDPGFGGERGLVNEVVERFGPYPEHEFYVAGPPAMVRATSTTLARLGVPYQRVHYDAVGVAP